jgi:hypothetical protein
MSGEITNVPFDSCPELYADERFSTIGNNLRTSKEDQTKNLISGKRHVDLVAEMNCPVSESVRTNETGAVYLDNISGAAAPFFIW